MPAEWVLDLPGAWFTETSYLSLGLPLPSMAVAFNLSIGPSMAEFPVLTQRQGHHPALPAATSLGLHGSEHHGAPLSIWVQTPHSW